jgi:hypothetical protein
MSVQRTRRKNWHDGKRRGKRQKAVLAEKGGKGGEGLSKHRDPLYKSAENLIASYESYKWLMTQYDSLKAVDRANALLATPNKPEVSGGWRPGKPTEQRALRLIEISADHGRRVSFYREAIAAVKQAYEYADAAPNGKQIRQIVKLYIVDRTHTIIGTAREVGYSRSQTIELKNRFVRDVMMFMGWKD